MAKIMWVLSVLVMIMKTNLSASPYSEILEKCVSDVVVVCCHAEVENDLPLTLEWLCVVKH